jgi:hypothetical protein
VQRRLWRRKIGRIGRQRWALTNQPELWGGVVGWLNVLVELLGHARVYIYLLFFFRNGTGTGSSRYSFVSNAVTPVCKLVCFLSFDLWRRFCVIRNYLRGTRRLLASRPLDAS